MEALKPFELWFLHFSLKVLSVDWNISQNVINNHFYIKGLGRLKDFHEYKKYSIRIVKEFFVVASIRRENSS